MPAIHQSEPPVALVAPKTLRNESGEFARKSALEKRDPVRLDRERRMARAFECTMRLLGLSDGKVGEMFGVSASVIRDMRCRKAPLQFEKFYRSAAPEAEVFRAALDAAFRAALLTNIAANDT